METSTVSGLRSRSRSKTPFLRSSSDREHFSGEGDDHIHHKGGRKTPIKRSTPVKQLSSVNDKRKEHTESTIVEEAQPVVSPHAHYTRQTTRTVTNKLMKTSDYSSEESPDRLRGGKKEIYQNQLNNKHEYERTNAGSFVDFGLSPIQSGDHTYTRSYNVTGDRSRFSPAHSVCSTDSSFAEQALADVSTLLERDPDQVHLPSRLYMMAREYWNKYPKTDYTYSRLSRDRVELAPGQVAMPNMSRRSLTQFRIQGPNRSLDEFDHVVQQNNSWSTSSSTFRRKHTAAECSDDEGAYTRRGYNVAEERWWITRLLITIVTTITESTRSTYRKIVGPSHNYPYTDYRTKKGVLSTAGSALASPFIWLYTIITKVVNTTVTTITETVSSNHVGEYGSHATRAASASKRRWWPWLLLLLLPLLGYGSYYAYENSDELALPNFADFQLDLSEFSSKLPSMNFPDISMPEFKNILPDINITLPEINLPDKMPDMPKAYYEYKDIVQNRMSDASDYMKVVADSCYEEMARFWRGVIA